MRWLDEQPARSVIYVVFGSEASAPLTRRHVRERELGLELAGARFLWALRGPSAALLPDGFEERVGGRGVVRVGWVPQVRILARGAVGAFLTHAGLSSLTESFLFGHPLVMLPLSLDQSVTARGMEERGVALEVPRDEGDGSFGRDDVATTVRRVMAEGGEGKAFARNARKLQAVLWNRAKQDEYYVDDLVDHLLRLRL
ncbi:UDP-glycosyltransferase 91D1-like [Triticum aestivum]|uniref:UDP-glycosyltransferase 91D1-like n=1 Tax=Triticum aestivum TaxID=4565 RepID=UPI001D0092E8|nr:UDP-glycosyltransferase 91D1-like [Triticum aestivum]